MSSSSSSSTVEKSKFETTIIQEVSSHGDLITLGPHTYRREELLNVLESQQKPVYTPSTQRKLANPVPLGLASFSLSCLVLSLVNANVRGVTNCKLLISLFMFFGGAIELFAGLLCFVTGDTYAMTVFSSFGGFWISWGCINTDQFHSISAYDSDPVMLANIEGFFLAGWTVFTFLMLMCTLKSTWGLFLLLTFLDLTFLLLTIGVFTGNNNVSMAGGYFGILASCCGWYSLYCAVVTPENSYLNLDAHVMPHFPTV
ncbi:hypothetical protein KAFR_0E03680 [Kazachstania africana CBS 2517]|uniref:Uncharacterized protein n=1 Tax=Kazachstania africana (strain ATCC 22294 / BCRC 22015 / CBS 2517 / CECT 1963 / NBRC 1671 / NRRL Y-8276) TaxID=1071382 RepID=H2AVW9_KAZAF|nr:hypothetical protein KAFR_0E03680 [Kazachstania africana CBS 2517]CCF58519.1 hypothetical protein KAFR_0E03680 [Kazachstania africana CBS 2517]